MMVNDPGLSAGVRHANQKRTGLMKIHHRVRVFFGLNCLFIPSMVGGPWIPDGNEKSDDGATQF